MKKLILVTIVLASILPMMANLAFDEPVPLYDFANYSIGAQNPHSSRAICPNGNQVILFVQSIKGIRNHYMQMYSPADEAMFPEPILVGNHWLYDYRLVANPDNNPSCHYFLMDSDGNIEIPADTRFGKGDIANLIPTDYGAYMVFAPYNGSHVSSYGTVQYYEVNNNYNPHPIPSAQLLSQNYPNPFNEKTNIRLNLNESAPATLKIYNIRGQYVKTLCNEEMPKGYSYLDWDGKDENGNVCASGVYIFRIKVNKKSETIKVLKLK